MTTDGSPGSITASASSQVNKPKRKKASRACSHCQKAHLTCDDARPCARCVKKGLSATCTDGQRKKAKYLLEEDELEERRRASEERAHAAASVPPPATATAPSSAPSAETSMTVPSELTSTQITDGTEESANTLITASASLPAYNTTVSFDSPASAATGPSGTGDGTFASLLEGNPDFNTSFHPFGTENASLEYGMLSSMIYGSGIDPSLLGTGLDDLALTQSPFFNDAGTAVGGGLGMDPSIGAGMYDGTSGGAGVGNVMYDGTSGMFDPVLAPPLMTMPSPSLAVNNFGMGPDPSNALGGLPKQEQLSSMGHSAQLPPSNLGSAPSQLSGFAASPQPLALQKFAQNNSTSSPDPQLMNQLLRLRPEEEDWDTRIRRVHTDHVEPFHYTDSYHFLLNYVTMNYEREEALRVVRALAIIRPSLIALQMPLSEEDEIFVERSIQRMALFLDKKSTIEYWEKFAMHAFENTSQSVVTRCVLLTPQGQPVPCSACFSIKRDMFDLPSLIVGNFLPIL
ncbi:Transcriptional regulator of nonfermentable carbon utilization [Tilletia horrida]|nr:Transcriptional regulator of nonfermentable carbon utilization [Tilletia horrida]